MRDWREPRARLENSTSLCTGPPRPVPRGPYSMERLGRDVLAVLDGLGLQKINRCGMSMGGMVGQWLAAHAANRIDKLILSNTSCYFPDKAMWDGRIKMVRDRGLSGMVDANMERWFTKGFRKRAAQPMEKIREMFLATDPEGISAAAKQSATWIIARYCRKSLRRRWSLPAGTIRQPRSKATNTSSSISPALSLPCSTRPISPIWSSPRPMPTPCSACC